MFISNWPVVLMEREMLRREGIKWHVADLIGHARLNPGGTHLQSLDVGPRTSHRLRHHMQLKTSRGQCRRGRGPTARPILYSLFPFFTRVAVAAGPPPRRAPPLRPPASGGKVRPCPCATRQGRIAGAAPSRPRPRDVAELAFIMQGGGGARWSASLSAGGRCVHVVRTSGGPGARGVGGADVAAA